MSWHKSRSSFFRGNLVTFSRSLNENNFRVRSKVTIRVLFSFFVIYATYKSYEKYNLIDSLHQSVDRKIFCNNFFVVANCNRVFFPIKPNRGLLVFLNFIFVLSQSPSGIKKSKKKYKYAVITKANQFFLSWEMTQFNVVFRRSRHDNFHAHFLLIDDERV